MTRTILDNGMIRLTSGIGIADTRTQSVYSEVICHPKSEHFFAEVEA